MPESAPSDAPASHQTSLDTKPLSPSPLSVEMMAHRSQVVGLMLNPHHKGGLGKKSFVEVEIALAKYSMDVARVLHASKTPPTRVGAEYFNYLVWQVVYLIIGDGFPFAAQKKLSKSNLDVLSTEYMDFVQRQRELAISGTALSPI